MPGSACAHLSCPLGGECVPAGHGPVLFPVSHTWEHPMSSHLCISGVQPYAFPLIPAVCWLDILLKVFTWGGAVSGLGRCLKFIFFADPLEVFQRSWRTLWTVLNFVILTTCYWIFFFPFAYISLTFNYCAGSCGVFFLSMVHCWPLRFSYVFDQLQSNNKWRCKFVVYFYICISK